MESLVDYKKLYEGANRKIKILEASLGRQLDMIEQQKDTVEQQKGMIEQQKGTVEQLQEQVDDLQKRDNYHDGPNLSLIHI